MNCTISIIHPQDSISLTDLKRISGICTDEWDENDVLNYIESDCSLILLHSTDESQFLLGYCFFKQVGNNIEIFDLIIDEYNRGEGYANVFISVLLQNYKGLRINLLVNETNHSAIKFYQKCKFELIAKYPHYYDIGETGLRYTLNPTDKSENNNE